MSDQKEFADRIARIQARAGQPAICHVGVVDGTNPHEAAKAVKKAMKRRGGLSRHALPLGVPVLGLALLTGAFWSDISVLLTHESVISASLK